MLPLTDELLDVELLVGKVTSLIPTLIILYFLSELLVFTTMFKSGMEEALAGRVRVDGVDLTTFRQFLEFLYTGTLSTWVDKSKVLFMANRYQIDSFKRRKLRK